VLVEQEALAVAVGIAQLQVGLELQVKVVMAAMDLVQQLLQT
jgi:hypothetical protein